MHFTRGQMVIAIWLAQMALLQIVNVHADYSQFIILPQNKSIIEGDDAIFKCRATPSNDLQYYWAFNGEPIESSTRVQQIDSNLRVNSVRRDIDEGDYICIARSKSSGARQASPPARLNVIWIETATVQLLRNRKDEIVLKCKIEGSSPDGTVQIEWFRNSEKLNIIDNIELLDDRLIIHHPSTNNNGLYRCVGSNSAGRAMSKKGYALKWSGDIESVTTTSVSGCVPRLRKNSLKIAEITSRNVFLCRGKRGGARGFLTADTDLPSPDDVSIAKIFPSGRLVVNESASAELVCPHNIPKKYRTSGVVQLRWRKDGKMFRQIELGQSISTTTSPNMEAMLREETRIILNRGNGSLIFQSVIASDAGLYRCQISIEGYRSVTSEPVDLEVNEQLKFMPQPTSKNLELGSVGKVHCKAQGTPTPVVKWIQEMSIGDNTSLPATINDINGTLTFKNVTAEHRGNYTCVAFNKQGQINATVSINVVVAPRFLLAPEGSIESTEMGVVSMHCQAFGDPKPTIQWDKDLKYLSENNTDKARFQFLENGTLEISDVSLEDEGRYGCTIGNSAGLKREEIHLIVKTREGYLSDEIGSEGFLITRAVLITVSVAFAYIILVVGLMIWCRFRRQARKARLNENMGDSPESGDGSKGAEDEPCLPDGSISSKKSSLKTKKVNGSNNARFSGNEAQKSDETVSSVNSKGSKKSHVFDQLALPRSGITELILIGRGEFGDVFVGKIKTSVIKMSDEKGVNIEKSSPQNGSGSTFAIEKRRSKTSMDDIEEIKEEAEDDSDGNQGQSLPGDNSYKLVLVKALNKVKEETACQEFKRQIEMFRGVSHKGVVRLYGLCREKDPHYLVLEHTDWGDLKQFLLATAGKMNLSKSDDTSNSPPPLKVGQILAVAYQIARGMDAIYRARFIHKDLATRNCTISSDFIVKVSYPAICKDKYNREYFKHRNALLPIRWLAPECIQEDDYTTKSDIYAFGVVVWELFNQATKIPFEELNNQELIRRSQANELHWKCADATPECLHEILMSCWSVNPKERPSFSQLCAALSKAMQTGDN